MSEIQELVFLCTQRIEQHLEWGDSQGWQSEDFEKLSDRIFQQTGVMLSSSTLKRIWGKVRYDSSPNRNTLNTLAKFIGFESWRAFASAQDLKGNPIQIEPGVTIFSEKSVSEKKLSRKWLIASVSLAVFFVAALIFSVSGSKRLRYGKLLFSSKALAFGVPNTVIFRYDATSSNADSVFIQQSWDPRRRLRVDKYKHEFASTYYLPGYYRAKLVLDDSVVKEHDLFIESNGWLGVIEKSPLPYYLPRGAVEHEGWLGISPKDVNINYTDYTANVPTFVLTRVDRGWEIPVKDLMLQVDLQNTFEWNNPCRRVSLQLLGTRGVITIPLLSPGCVGEAIVRLGDNVLEGSTNDLSAFGVDFSKLVRLSCISTKNSFQVFIDGKLAYRGTAIQGTGNIVGVRISFTGTGILKNFKLSRAIK
ncbi:hypothetical protein [Pedobacter suwonensis]|uniref:hypothetical protein n=1 Tax=Pedobacter suwonensis TaxID=332999 RepID=UPI0036C55051